MALSDYEDRIRLSPLPLLEKGFIQLSEMEVNLEERLKEVREAKVRFLVEIDIRVNSKK